MLAIYHSTTQRRKHSNVKEPSWTNVNIAGESDGTESQQEERSAIRLAQVAPTMVVCALACVMLLVCCLWSAEPTYAKTNAATASGSCAVLMRWPLNGAQVVGKYDAPKQQWLPGHRGVDLLADLRKPSSRRGRRDRLQRQRGGKAVVTIRHGGDLSGLTSTFEPAIAERDVGAHVAQGERFARVEGESDHCDERCLHWGIKSEGRQYTNPESKTRTVRIGLKGL